jgi:uncharacterized protein YbaP (TraB family)
MHFPLAYALRALLCAAWACLAPFAAAQTSPEARHFLWEVTSMTNRAYLFGTIHAGKREWYPLPRAVEDAFADSEVLAVEADVTDVEAMEKTAGSMAYKPPDELMKHVPLPDYERFREQLPRYGMPIAKMKTLKPFAAVSMLVFGEWARLGYLPQFGVDYYLIQKAKGAKKKLVEVEGVEAQAKLMDSITEEEHRQAFTGTLDALDAGLTGEQIEGMVKAWQSGDAFLMLEIARRYNEKVPGARELEDKFVWARHKAMLEKVEGYLNKSKERHFIAVGSLHLAGPKGLVEELRAKGYIVKQR